jgi:hypothetical protein
MELIHTRWGALIDTLCRGPRPVSPAAAFQSLTPASHIPAEFLAALIAIESDGEAAPRRRFEPAVYAKLLAVRNGDRTAYGAVTREALQHKTVEGLHLVTKTSECHAGAITTGFIATHADELSNSAAAMLMDLASSWGLTQIMGYHLCGRAGVPACLEDPELNLAFALAMLAEFTHRYRLDLSKDLAELFTCWNTGGPWGKTYDPDYAVKGLYRMGIYREIAAAAGQKSEVRSQESGAGSQESGAL